METGFDEKEFLDIMDRIYQIPYTGSWEEVASLLAKKNDDFRISIFGQDEKASEARYFASINGDIEYQSKYEEYYKELNPYAGAYSSMPLGTPYRLDDLCPPNQLWKTEFFNDFMVPQGAPWSGGVATLYRDRWRYLVIAGVFSGDQPEKEKRWIAQLEKLSPHLMRTFDLYNKLAESRAFTDIFDRFNNNDSCWIYFLDARRRVRYANRLGKRALDERSEVYLDSSGRFELAGIGEQVQLFRADVSQCIDIGDKDDPRSRRLVLTTPVDFIASEELSEFFGYTDIKHLAVISGFDGGEYELASKLISIYGLTKSETEILYGFYNGYSLSDLAARQKKSIHTIRNQMKNIQAKTFTKSQTQLMKLVANVERIRRYADN